MAQKQPNSSLQSPLLSTPVTSLTRRRKTRIVATLGPASASKEMIAKLSSAGVDVFRINMSHGAHEDKIPLFENIRAVEHESGRPIAILADLQGPKLRVGTFGKDGGIVLKKGANFRLDLDTTPGNDHRVNLPHPEIFAALEKKAELLLDDGKLKLEVLDHGSDFAECRVIVGGRLSNRKGVNVPGVLLPLAALTKKDHRDLDFALKMQADWIALSFVQRAADVAEAKKIVAGKAAIMAKIEKPQAVLALDEIIDIADGVMVARGDLGVEEPIENVPGIQRAIIKKARNAGKPVVVATQMLESMINSPVPTRAEVSDVATAVQDRADAIMLSAESAVGDYPIEAVAVMDRVAWKTEQDDSYLKGVDRYRTLPMATAEDAITAGAHQVADTINARCIITFTTSGATAMRAARERPNCPVLVLTPRLETARKLAIIWGLRTVKTRDIETFEEMIAKAKRMALRTEMVSPGERIVVTAGVPFKTTGATNVLHIALVTGNELDEYNDSQA